MRGKELSSMMRGVLSIAIVTLTCVSAARAGTEEVLHTFMGVTQRGATPQGSLVADAAGNLYGTTLRGGVYGYGTVFEVTPGSDGKWKESVLYSFQNGNDGADPSPGLVFDAAGNLFGSCQSGSVFELSPSSKGWTITTLYLFGTTEGDGSSPNGSLVFDRAGNLFGTTALGPHENPISGTVFELMPAPGGQWTETVLYTFGGGYDGSEPTGGVIFDEYGNLYGTTQRGGANHYVCQEDPPGCGTVFKLTPSRDGYWSETLLYSFGSNYPHDGVFPSGSLTLDASGNLYGAAGIVFRLSHGSWKEDILFDFSGGNDGANPNGNLVFDSAGNLYGTALLGANSGCPDYSYQDNGCGTVFKLSPGKGGWKEHTLYRFIGHKDGGIPIGGVVLDSAGNVYGAASTKGIAGAGTIFKVSSEPGNRWKETTVYGFTSGDGSTPEAGLVSDSEGNFYGTTSSGGYGSQYCEGCLGTVVKLSRDAKGHWSRSLLYGFKGGNDGAGPTGLILDQAGNLYGTTEGGGSSQNLGTVFEVSNISGHWTEKVLYSFQIMPDGGNPNGALIFDSSGNLYGTTEFGGTYGYGTVYKLSPSSGGGWTESVLYSFHGSSDGGAPKGGLIFDSAGNLYGTTIEGGENCSGYGCGVVFELSPSSAGWTETVLYAFTGATDGANPYSGLVVDSFGNLYGTTLYGGDPNCYGGDNNGGCGTVFELSRGLVWTETVIHAFGGGAGAKHFTSPAFDHTNNPHGAIRKGERPPKCDSEKHGIGSNQDGADPEGSLVFDSSGNLYGTTAFGGYSPYGCY
jgi:uncharacterized repeat protein (TIGR03803 family)